MDLGVALLKRDMWVRVPPGPLPERMMNMTTEEFDEIVKDVFKPCLCGHQKILDPQEGKGHKTKEEDEPDYPDRIKKILKEVAPREAAWIEKQPCLECGCDDYRENGVDLSWQDYRPEKHWRSPGDKTDD